MFAPRPKSAFQGKLLGASYDLRTRSTSIYFLSETGTKRAVFHHDTFLVSIPASATVPEFPTAQPAITLRREAGWLNSYSSKRKLSALMAVDASETLQIVYPVPVHPDLVALWSINTRMFFTNNDYRNIYELPPEMLQPLERPRLRSRFQR
jgi:hypothetical protein